MIPNSHHIARALLVAGTLSLAISACQRRAPAPATEAESVTDSTGATAEPTGAPRAALRTLFRQSLEYRNAHRALANNAATLASDISRTNRMLTEVGALLRLPLAPDEEADRGAVEAAIRAQAASVGVTVTEVEVETRPGPPPPPAEMSTEAVFEYSRDQVLGVHDVRVTLANGLLSGPTFVQSLPEMPRLFVARGAQTLGDGTVVIVAEVGFLRGLPPMSMVLPPLDVEALIAEAAGDTPLTPHEGGLADQIRQHYAEAVEVRPRVEEALRNEAVVDINTARFQAYSDWVDHFNSAPRWTNLLRAGLPN